jgi:hypothetical protein
LLERQRWFTPLLTAPGSAREPVLLGQAAVGAPELLASPSAEGVVPGDFVPSLRGRSRLRPDIARA